jgi:hypothetical protein
VDVARPGVEGVAYEEVDVADDGRLRGQIPHVGRERVIPCVVDAGAFELDGPLGLGGEALDETFYFIGRRALGNDRGAVRYGKIVECFGEEGVGRYRDDERAVFIKGAWAHAVMQQVLARDAL